MEDEAPLAETVELLNTRPLIPNPESQIPKADLRKREQLISIAYHSETRDPRRAAETRTSDERAELRDLAGVAGLGRRRRCRRSRLRSTRLSPSSTKTWC